MRPISNQLQLVNSKGPEALSQSYGKSIQVMNAFNTSLQNNVSVINNNIKRHLDLTQNSYKAVQNNFFDNRETTNIFDSRQINNVYVMQTAVERVADATAAASESQADLAGASENSAASLEGLFGKLKEVAGLNLDAQSMMGFADGVTQASVKVAALNDGLQSNYELEQSILAASQSTKTSYGETVQAMTAMEDALGSGFGSTEELLQFTEQLTMAYKIEGADPEQVGSGMQDVAGGLEDGRIDTSELASNGMMAGALAGSMGISEGALTDLAARGALTADYLKNAMSTSADVLNEKFSKLPTTFAELGVMIQNSMTNFLAPMIELVGRGAQFISSNWSVIEPIIWGLVAAYTAWKLITFATDLATKGLNMTLLKNPIFYIALAIGLLVVLIRKWIDSVGGLSVAWLIVKNNLLLGWDLIKIGFYTGVYAVMNLFDKMRLGFMRVSVGIQNVVGDMKAGVLVLLQGLVNEGIDIINGFIGVLNSIKGVSIEAVQKVTFGTDAALKNEAEKQMRNAELAGAEDEMNARMKEREATLDSMKLDMEKNFDNRQAEIEAAQNQMPSGEETNGAQMLETMNQTAANTGTMAGTMSMAEEDLKYMRDLAEQEVINRYTTSEIKVEMHNQNAISSDMDIDGVISTLEDKLYESMILTAEGVHA